MNEPARPQWTRKTIEGAALRLSLVLDNNGQRLVTFTVVAANRDAIARASMTVAEAREAHKGLGELLRKAAVMPEAGRA